MPDMVVLIDTHVNLFLQSFTHLSPSLVSFCHRKFAETFFVCFLTCIVTTYIHMYDGVITYMRLQKKKTIAVEYLLIKSWSDGNQTTFLILQYDNIPLILAVKTTSALNAFAHTELAPDLFIAHA